MAPVCQEPQPKANAAQDGGVVLRQTVRRVRVDVVVTDSQGNPVKGLQASDFHVAEDGKPQSIRQFEWRSEDVNPDALPERPPLPQRTFVNLPPAPERGPLTVLLYDTLNTPSDYQATARAQMLEFLKKNSGRRMAVFALADRLHILQGFTQDTDSLERAASSTATMPHISSYRFADTTQLDNMQEFVDVYDAEKAKELGDKGFKPSATELALDRVVAKEKAMEARERTLIQDRHVEITLDALAKIGHFLSGFSGRKSLLWFSGSFPASVLLDQDGLGNTDPRAQFHLDPSHVPNDVRRNYTERIKEATNLLNTAEVAVYAIDARGLRGVPTYNANSVAGSGVGGAVEKDEEKLHGFLDENSSSFAAMDLVSEQTGGHAFYNTNALAESLEKAANDGNTYYSLLYEPSNAKFDGGLRRISVHLARGHYHLAYRRSYFAVDSDSPGNPTASENEAEAIADAMAGASQFGAPPAHDLIFAAHVEPIGEPALATVEQAKGLVPYRKRAANLEHTKFDESPAPVMMQSYAIMYAVLAKQLTIPRSADSRYHSDLSFAALAFDADGMTLFGSRTQLKDSIPVTQIGEIQKGAFKAVQTFTVPVNTAVIRLALRDEQSGRTGSMEIRLPLPPDQQHTERGESAGAPKGSSPVATP